MLTIFATIVFIIGIVAAIIGMPMAALGCWFLALICAIGIVGVKPTRDKDAPGAIKLIVRHPAENSQQKQPSGHFSAKAFLQFHDIPYKGKNTQSFDAEWSEQYEMILIDLSKPRDVSRRKKTDTEDDEPNEVPFG